MAKIQKKQKEKRLKKHLHLSITAELYNEVKKIGLNVSVFLEKALISFISGMNTRNMQNKFILNLESKKKCCERDPNPRPSDYESDALTS